jgi:hypothetical protein
MADSLNTIGSIATYLLSSFNNISTAVSGTLIQLVDLSRQNVANYAGITIGSNSISDIYQPAIINFAKADVVDLINAQAGGEQISLGELSLSETGEAMSAEQYRKLAEMFLKNVGRKIQFSRSLS